MQIPCLCPKSQKENIKGVLTESRRSSTAGESLLAISGLPLQAPDQSNKCQISAINIVEPAAHMMLAKAKPIKFGLLQVQILATGCSLDFCKFKYWHQVAALLVTGNCSDVTSASRKFVQRE